jgi:hypothetical protein
MKEHFDGFVGINNYGYFIAYLLNKNAIYYSLEISKSFLNRFIFNVLKVKLLIIQSKERKEYLCPKDIDIVYIQNSNILPSKNIKYKFSYCGKLIYFGNIIKEHGIEICINSLYGLKDETLTVKGLEAKDTQYLDYLKWQYQDLIDEEHLFFELNYIEQDNVIEYLQQFDIGFCFYDYSLINRNDFNYISSPSGKMFNYFTAGLPVIGNDSIGLSPIKECQAGILVTTTVLPKIVTAIKIINRDYITFQQNAIKASIKYNYFDMFEANNYKIRPPPPPRRVLWV